VHSPFAHPKTFDDDVARGRGYDADFIMDARLPTRWRANIPSKGNRKDRLSTLRSSFIKLASYAFSYMPISR